MEISVEELKLKIDVVKSKLRRFNNFVKGLDLNNLSQVILNNLTIRLDKVEPLLGEFDELQMQIEWLEKGKNYELEREQFESEYFDLIGQTKALILVNNGNNNDNVSVHSGRSVASSNESPKIKLPPVKLPTFDGKPENWLEFKELFNEMVNEDKGLSDVQKFYYLKSSLAESVQKKLRSKEISSKNYAEVWKCLEERYENKSMSIYDHIHAIFQLPTLHKESHEDLQNLIDDAMTHLRSLTMLGELTETWDRMIIYILANKLDSVTRRAWEGYKFKGELPEIADMEEFLKQRCQFLMKIKGSQTVCKSSSIQNKVEVKNKILNKKSYSNSLAVVNEGSDNIKKIICYFCKGEHSIFKCSEFLKLNNIERNAEIKKLKLCLNCFRPTHASWQCKLSKCQKCKKPHNTIIHVDNLANMRETNTTNGEIGERTANEHVHTGSSQETKNAVAASVSLVNANKYNINTENSYNTCQGLLCTAKIMIKNNKDKWITCRAVLDPGSQSNLISEALCKKLNIKGSESEHSLLGVGQFSTEIKNQIQVEIKSCMNNYSLKLKCFVLPVITTQLPVQSFDKNKLNIPDKVKLADPEFNMSAEVELLLSTGVFWNIICEGRIKLGTNMPTIQNTQFGWIIGGNMLVSKIGNNKKSVSCLITNEIKNTLEDKLLKFWELEEVNNKTKMLSSEEKLCELDFERNTERIDGRFVVRIPFKETVNNLGESYEIVLRRFELLEKRLNKNIELKSQYCEFMAEYKELNHMTEISKEDFNHSDGYFMPHHAVLKKDSITCKCRVVFDSSCKTSSGLSLNDVQFVGPTLQQDVFAILVRFRQYSYVMTSDVSKMYRQILINKDHHKYQRILWRETPTDELKIYELNRVTYGNASSPFLAVRCLFQLAYENQNKYPEACEVIKRDFYMDDLLTGTDSVEQLLKVQSEITSILATGGFELRKWLCNQGELLNKFKINKELEVGLLQIGEQESNKTLGVYWNANKDVIQYKINNDINRIKCTKRSVLSTTSQLFDPLGLLGPIIINAKLIMQELWKEKLDWDQSLPEGLEIKWWNFRNDLEQLINLEIPRQALVSNSKRIELHGFCDASEAAYGACIYVRCVSISDNKIEASLLCAKSRVAPIKRVTLPRLELCGALLLANLAKKVIESMNLKFDQCYYWTDSMITLAWIKESPHRWKTFVANRVSEIQTLTNKNQWYHVRSQENPADLLSRGTTTEILKNSELWWFGPTWFRVDSSNWTVNEINASSVQIPDEKTVSLIAIAQNNEVINKLLHKYSNLIKLQRVFALALRFISNVKVKNKEQRSLGFLSPVELENSLHTLIRCVQMECFPQEYRDLEKGGSLNKKSRLLSLNPFIADKLMRVGGRIRHCNLEYSKKFPIILPKNNILTILIVRAEHERLLHCGVQALLCSIRSKFWPLSGRSSCKKIVNSCITCFKAKPKECSNYLMGDLPEVRVNISAPFTNVGVDYGGPFQIKDRKTRGAKLVKAYLCLFVCMATRAVHLELVSDLTTDAFLATLSRFVSRRGKPINIFSDNGLNFIGTNNELTKIYNFLKDNNELILNSLCNERIKWHFIPARAPNFGGIWEAGIKSTKYHLKRLLNGPLNFEEFTTLICQIESILNSRPICPVSQDPDDLTALTPGHFLIGKALTSLPEVDLKEIPENRLSRWQHVQAMTQHFWTRWSKEYLNELQTRVKWKWQAQEKLKVGALVLIKNDNAPTQCWKLGRISRLRPGKDGVIRVVDVKVPAGEITRAISNICVLPIDC